MAPVVSPSAQSPEITTAFGSLTLLFLPTSISTLNSHEIPIHLVIL